MTRITSHVTAAFAAIVITLVSLQAITVVPPPAGAIATIPALA